MNRAACWWRKATLLAKVLAGGSVLFEFVNLNLVGETWFYSDKQQRIWFIHPNTLQTVQQLRGIPPMDGSGILTFLSNLNLCLLKTTELKRETRGVNSSWISIDQSNHWLLSISPFPVVYIQNPYIKYQIYPDNTKYPQHKKAHIL